MEEHILFVDYTKALDKISRLILSKIMRNKDMALHLVKVVVV
jgi:hypothetical protein